MDRDDDHELRLVASLRELFASIGPRGPVLGFVDGVMNALALASASILDVGRQVTFGLALRVSLFAAVTGWFVLFVSTYVDLRSELVHAARELNLGGRGRLALTSLGRTVFREALREAAAGGAASFIGCLIPLLIAWLTPRHGWIGMLSAFVMLACLGASLARFIHGRSVVWSGLLVLGGIVLAGIGRWLKIA